MKRINEHASDYLSEDYRQQVIKMLTNAYLEEISAFYAYFTVIPYLVGQDRTAIANFYKEAAKDELYDHAEWILKRIAELGGIPTDAMDINNLKLAQHPYIIPKLNNNQIDVKQSLIDNIQAEKNAIYTYRLIEEQTRNGDIITNDKIKHILMDETEHLQELEDLLNDQKQYISADYYETFTV